MNLQTIIAWVLKWIKLGSLADLFALEQVAIPLPDFRDAAATTTWLNALTIGGPLKTLILGWITNLPAPSPGLKSSAPITEEDIRAEFELQSQFDSDGRMRSFDPATIAKIVKFIYSLLPLFGLL